MKTVGWAFVIVIILFFIACIEIGLDPAYPNVEPQWSGTVTRIPYPYKYDYECGFEFSDDSRLICIYQYPTDLNHNTFGRNVFDIQGNPVKDATNTDQSFTPQYRNRFHLAIPRASDGTGDRVQVESYWRYQAAHAGPAQSPEQRLALRRASGVVPSITFKWRDLPCLDLLLKTNSWCLNDDLSEVLCLMSPPKADDECRTLELWGVTPTPQKKWSITLNDGIFGSWTNAGFFEKGGEKFIMIDDAYKCFIIAQDDGRVVGQFKHDDGGHSDLEPRRRFLAAPDGREVRIYSLDPPYKLLQWFNPPAPYADDKAYWHISGIQFVGGHYVSVNYVRSYERGIAIRFEHSRGAYKEAYLTILYDLETGKPAWQRYSDQFQKIHLSPDGKKLAIKKGSTLEIGDFVPQLAALPDAALNRK